MFFDKLNILLRSEILQLQNSQPNHFELLNPKLQIVYIEEYNLYFLLPKQ